MIVKARFRPVEPEPGEVASAEARLLALAYAVEAALEEGRFRSVAGVAGVLGLSRSRLSQLMRPRWVAVGAHESMLAWPPQDVANEDTP